MLRRFLRSFESCPAAMLGAWEPLHLPAAQRHSTLVSLQAAVKASCPGSPHKLHPLECYRDLARGEGASDICLKLVKRRAEQRATHNYPWMVYKYTKVVNRRHYMPAAAADKLMLSGCASSCVCFDYGDRPV